MRELSGTEPGRYGLVFESEAGLLGTGTAEMNSNCLIYAIYEYVKAFRKDRKTAGYIGIRVSDWGPFFHFLYIPGECAKGGDCKTVESFVPDKPVRRIFPPLIFKGHIKKGDRR